jgi:hypothetical protein
MYSPKVIAASRRALEEHLGFPLREYSKTEVQDFAFRLKDVEWVPGETNKILAGLPQDIQEYVVNELQMSKIDFKYWLTRYGHVVDDSGFNVPMIPWPSQEMVINKLAMVEEAAWDTMERLDLPALQAKVGLIILKARQMGGTAISEGLLSHQAMFFSRTRAAIASDHIDNSLKLFRVLLNFVDSVPGWMHPVENARVKNNNIHFSELDSDVITGAGNQKSTLGQGMTVDCCHLTEVSTWDPLNAHAIDADMRPAFMSSKKHHSLFIIESTGAGGMGNWFHDHYQGAMTGNNLFKALFIGWFHAPAKWSMDPEGIQISEETQGILKNIKAEYGVECTKSQAAWYEFTRNDYKSSGKLDLFIQEFPNNPEEAFSFGTKSAWPVEVRSKVRAACKLPKQVFKLNLLAQRLEEIDALEFMRDEDPQKTDGVLLVWERAMNGYTYIVGVDSSYGVVGGDSSAIEVLRVGNKYYPDEQVAEWHGSVSPADLAIPCWLIGHMYTDKIEQRPALMAIECNPGSPGIVAQTDLMRRGYGNFYIYKRPLKAAGGGWSSDVGWFTNQATRPAMTEEGVKNISRGDLLINSPYFVKEMDHFGPQFTRAGMKKLEHAPGHHDDRIIALFISSFVAHEADTRSMADHRRKSLEQMNPATKKTVQLAELGLPMDQAMELWENSLALDE